MVRNKDVIEGVRERCVRPEPHAGFTVHESQNATHDSREPRNGSYYDRQPEGNLDYGCHASILRNDHNGTA